MTHDPDRRPVPARASEALCHGCGHELRWHTPISPRSSGDFCRCPVERVPYAECDCETFQPPSPAPSGAGAAAEADTATSILRELVNLPWGTWKNRAYGTGVVMPHDEILLEILSRASYVLAAPQPPPVADDCERVLATLRAEMRALVLHIERNDPYTEAVRDAVALVEAAQQRLREGRERDG